MEQDVSLELLLSMAQVLLVPAFMLVIYEIRKTRGSIEELNVTIAVSNERLHNVEREILRVRERTHSHANKIQKHEGRITLLEKSM
jgi:cell division protein FtsL